MLSMPLPCFSFDKPPSHQNSKNNLDHVMVVIASRHWGICSVTQKGPHAEKMIMGMLVNYFNRRAAKPSGSCWVPSSSISILWLWSLFCSCTSSICLDLLNFYDKNIVEPSIIEA